MRKIHCLCLLACIAVFKGWAARVDTLQVESSKMKGKRVETVVVMPDCVQGEESYPVLYLLHGYGGNARTWLSIKPELRDMVDRDRVIVVCPDGRNSWYWDSPLRNDSQYETLVATELVSYIDAHYPTIRKRSARAIAGLSMGGHGAMWLSIRHQEVFGAAGSMSGGVDIRPFPNNWEMKVQLGEKERWKDVWDAHTVMTQLDLLKNGGLALIIDCGVDDFFLKVNECLHEELVRRKIAHDFIIRPGEHNAAYWNNAIDYQWLFFMKFFGNGRL